VALNKYKAHLYVLPEDDATKDIAVGFNDAIEGPMQVLKPAGGWTNVLKLFKETYISHLRQYANAHLVLLIDFDDDFPNRLQNFRNEIPQDVEGRVYVLGALTEAETLRTVSRMSFSKIGIELANECSQNTAVVWDNSQAKHNHPERMRIHAGCSHFLL
jgi:hypothetical protein